MRTFTELEVAVVGRRGGRAERVDSGAYRGRSPRHRVTEVTLSHHPIQYPRLTPVRLLNRPTMDPSVPLVVANGTGVSPVLLVRVACTEVGLASHPVRQSRLRRFQLPRTWCVQLMVDGIYAWLKIITLSISLYCWPSDSAGGGTSRLGSHQGYHDRR